MRKITSLSMAMSFLVMVYTGGMLFVAPHGKVANWSNWELWGLDKTEYTNIHVTSMVVLVFFFVWHMYYNWKPLMSYMKNKTSGFTVTKKEFLIALALNVFFIGGTLALIQPFSGFLAFEEDIKMMWTETYGEPPYGHAEDSTLNVFCSRTSIDCTKAKSSLRNQNILFDDRESIGDIARKNQTTPNAIYQMIKQGQSAQTSIEHTDSNTPPMLGKRTLNELSSEGNIDLQKSLSYLQAKNINGLSENTQIKTISSELGMSNADLYRALIRL